MVRKYRELSCDKVRLVQLSQLVEKKKAAWSSPRLESRISRVIQFAERAFYRKYAEGPCSSCFAVSVIKSRFKISMFLLCLICCCLQNERAVASTRHGAGGLHPRPQVGEGEDHPHQGGSGVLLPRAAALQV
jgi:hypothetical protein